MLGVSHTRRGRVFGGICIVLVAAVPLLGQRTGGILGRIETAPLPAGKRQAVATAYSEHNFARIESILAGTVTPDVPAGHAAELEALLGAIEFLGGRMVQSVQSFRRSDSLQSLDDQDRFTLAMALVALSDGKGARAELNRLNGSHPGEPIYLYWLGRLDYDQRLYSEAIKKFKRVISLDPNSVLGYDNLGLSFDMMGLPGEARSAFEKAVALNRKLPAPSPWPPLNLGSLLLRLQQFHQAEDSLRESLKYNPRFALAHYHLGRALENQGRGEAAIGEFKSAAALDATFAEPLYSLGLLYRRLGHSAEAESALAEYKRRKAGAQ